MTSALFVPSALPAPNPPQSVPRLASRNFGHERRRTADKRCDFRRSKACRFVGGTTRTASISRDVDPRGSTEEFTPLLANKHPPPAGPGLHICSLYANMPHSVNGSSATMSRPSSTSTNSANAFPKPAGATLLAPEPIGDQLSPSRSTFSFESSPKSGHGGSERGVAFNDARHIRPVSRGAPGEKKEIDAVGQRQQNYGTRRRTQYYEEQFAYKDDSVSSARDRVTKDAPIIADLRTNVIVCLTFIASPLCPEFQLTLTVL